MHKSQMYLLTFCIFLHCTDDDDNVASLLHLQLQWMFNLERVVALIHFPCSLNYLQLTHLSANEVKWGKWLNTACQRYRLRRLLSWISISWIHLNIVICYFVVVVSFCSLIVFLSYYSLTVFDFPCIISIKIIINCSSSKTYLWFSIFIQIALV